MSEWERMDGRPRRHVESLTHASLISGCPGVYAFYREGERTYVGSAGNLRERLWRCHLRKVRSMTNSAFRRNVAEHFGIASAADIKARRYMPTIEDANVVSTFVAATELAWIECDTEDEARLLENRLKAEFMPPFTKR